MAGLFPSLDFEWTLPPASRSVWRTHRRWVVERAVGRVLDLGGPDRRRRHYPHAASVDHISDPARLRAGASYDTVVSILRIGQSADPERLLATVAAALVPGAGLVFLEHTRSPGAGQRAQRAVSPVWRVAMGHHVDRDVPALVRAAGLVITDLDRFTMPTNPWPARSFARGVARLTPEARPAGPGPGAVRRSEQAPEQAPDEEEHS